MILIQKIIFFFIFFCVLAGCKRSDKITLTTSKKFLTTDRYMTLSSYCTFSQENNDYLCVYDSRMKNVRVFSLNKGCLIKSIFVKNLFATESDEEIRTISVKNFDSIFLAGTYYIRMIDSASNNKFQFIYRKPETDTFPEKAYGEFSGVFPLYYDSQTKNLFLRQYLGNVFLYSPKFYRYPLEAAFSLKDSTFKSIPEYFPKKYQNSYFGDLNNAYREVVNDKHILSFNADDTVYVYDRKTTNTEKFSCKSQFKITEIRTMPEDFKDDVNRKIEHILQSPYYLNIIFDKYRKCYYRFFLNSMPLKKSDNTYNSINDKEKILMVLNENFNVVKEMKLPRNSLLSLFFITEEGLYIRSGDKINQTQIDSIKNNTTNNAKKIETENLLSFDLYKFSFN